MSVSRQILPQSHRKSLQPMPIRRADDRDVIDVKEPLSACGLKVDPAFCAVSRLHSTGKSFLPVLGGRINLRFSPDRIIN
jgi:hypothetical protein